MSDAQVFRWSRPKMGLGAAFFVACAGLARLTLLLEPSDVETMSRGRFEANELIIRIALPFFVYGTLLFVLRFAAPTVLCPRFRENRLRVPVHSIVPWSRWFDLSEVVGVGKSFPFVVLALGSDKKVKITAHLLADQAGFMATLRERIDVAAPAGRVPPE